MDVVGIYDHPRVVNAQVVGDGAGHLPGAVVPFVEELNPLGNLQKYKI